MKKRILAFTLVTAMLATTACGVKTRDSVQGSSAAGGDAAAQTSASTNGGKTEAVDINLLFMSINEEEANVVRDQLAKAGFNVKLNMQPDYSSYKAQIEAGNYDLDIAGWTTVTGNPDYAVRALFVTGGDSNDSPFADPKLDEYINKAATETPEEYKKTYGEFEKYLVDEMAYIVPLYQSTKTQGINLKKINPESVRISKSRSMVWEAVKLADGQDMDTVPMITQQIISTLTSLDPIKGNDGSINMLNTNMYVRLVNLTDDDQVVSDGSLSYNHAIADGNTEYYFILRDDINFARVENGHAVDSGVLVGGEDVVFSLDRAKDKNSVPNHKTYSLHEHIKSTEIVTDLADLEGKKVSGSEDTVKTALEKNLAVPIAGLAATKDKVDNSTGSYQVVKVTTTEPFPQVLNYLAHQSAGIVDSSVIPAINTYDVANYDVSKDISYGDQSTITEGSSYNNTLSCSGPYIAVKKNDYEISFEKNPAYMPETENFPKIKNVIVKFIADYDSALSALRSDELDILYTIPEKSYDIVEKDSNLKLQKIPSNGVNFMKFNLREGSKFTDVNLRKAVSSAINQEELLAVFNGTRHATYSTVTTLIDTGNQFVFTPGKTQEYLNAYFNVKK